MNNLLKLHTDLGYLFLDLTRTRTQCVKKVEKRDSPRETRTFLNTPAEGKVPIFGNAFEGWLVAKVHSEKKL